MKRSPLARNTPMKRKKAINRARPERAKRSAPPRPVDWVPKRVIRRAGKNHTPSKAESAHMGAVAKLGCIAKSPSGKRCGARCAIHHVRMGYGAGQRASHWEVLPLCPMHHQNGPMGVAFHAGEREWQKIHGTELDLLHEVYEALGIDFDRIPELRGDEIRPIVYPPWWASELRRRTLEAVYG